MSHMNEKPKQNIGEKSQHYLSQKIIWAKKIKAIDSLTYALIINQKKIIQNLWVFYIILKFCCCMLIFIMQAALGGTHSHFIP